MAWLCSAYCTNAAWTAWHLFERVWADMKGNCKVKAAVAIVAEFMTPAQIAEAQRRAGKWRHSGQSGAAPDN